MSNICRNLFQISDVISGGVFGISLLGILLAFIVPPVTLVVTSIIYGLNLGHFGLVFALGFLLFTYLTYKHVALSLLGHFVLIVSLFIFSIGIPYFYTVLFFIYLMPYIAVYQVAKKT
jgi:hypothetical protein